jgi:MoaA/NifB/PqqE/SkfB family radical SAM enzyme
MCSQSFLKTKGLMSLDLFKRIMDKVEKESEIRLLRLYNWGDPVVHPALDEIVVESLKRGHRPQISTTLNGVRCDLEKVITSGVSTFYVSFSGWRDYTKTHVGGNLDTVLKNLEIVAKAKPYNVDLAMRFHIYKHNQDEVERAKELCDRLGIRLQAHNAFYVNIDKYVDGKEIGDDGDMLIERHADILRKYKYNSFCYIESKVIPMDAKGDVYLCCGTPYEERFLIGNYLDYPLQELRKRRFAHGFCGDCKLSKINNLVTRPESYP